MVGGVGRAAATPAALLAWAAVPDAAERVLPAGLRGHSGPTSRSATGVLSAGSSTVDAEAGKPASARWCAPSDVADGGAPSGGTTGVDECNAPVSDGADVAAVFTSVRLDESAAAAADDPVCTISMHDDR